MNPEIKQRWTSALRSGEYQQTKGFLRTVEGYCCLGVLCDLYSKETGVEWSEYKPENDISKLNSSFLGELATLPQDVVEWSCIGDQNPYVKLGEEYLILSTMNDDGVEFSEIANTIEKYF